MKRHELLEETARHLRKAIALLQEALESGGPVPDSLIGIEPRLRGMLGDVTYAGIELRDREPKAESGVEK